MLNGAQAGWLYFQIIARAEKTRKAYRSGFFAQVVERNQRAQANESRLAE